MRTLLLFALPAFAFAQTARITAELGKTTVYGGLALSPDGKNLAWTQTLASQEQPKLWIGAVDGAFADLRFAGPHTESDPSWSPDSKTLAALLRQQLSFYRDLWASLDDPFQAPPALAGVHDDARQLEITW